MNFFQFAQSSQSSPVIPFPSSTPSALKLPPGLTNGSNGELKKSLTTKDINENTTENTINPAFAFNKKKVTFLNLPEDYNPQSHIEAKAERPAIVSNSNRSDEEFSVPNQEEITEENIENHLTRLEEGMKLISSWSQSQKQLLLNMEEEIGFSKIEASKLLTAINSIINTETAV